MPFDPVTGRTLPYTNDNIQSMAGRMLMGRRQGAPISSPIPPQLANRGLPASTTMPVVAPPPVRNIPGVLPARSVVRPVGFQGISGFGGIPMTARRPTQ